MFLAVHSCSKAGKYIQQWLTVFWGTSCCIWTPITPVAQTFVMNAAHLHHIIRVRMKKLQSVGLNVSSGWILEYLKAHGQNWRYIHSEYKLRFWFWTVWTIQNYKLSISIFIHDSRLDTCLIRGQAPLRLQTSRRNNHCNSLFYCSGLSCKYNS